ncbi:MAG: aldehyde dehydrogenase [Myxococcota bacterium]|jgi:aminomuconate-semialdehyde/2-hydroxymuconate-6-semialdehyde dehydrogenase|nr:aldehyde dehydrogenase [Myxococcota bacterium]
MEESLNLKNFVNGNFVATEKQLENVEPAQGRILSYIPRSGVEEVDAAVVAAKNAFASWSQTTLDARAELLDAVADEIESHTEEFALLESRDTGKPLSLARDVDIPRAISNFRFFAGAVRHASLDANPMADAINYTQRTPLGVVALITPWNLPLYLLSWKTAPALAMGNTIVAKPSELTPHTATRLAEVFSKVGLPDGVFNLVHGLGAEVGDALVKHPDVSAVSFTGGTSTGKLVAANAAPAFKKLSLELGGKNPTVVFADCDFEKAVAGTLRAAFTNQGEICLCGSRILVEESIFDAFTDALVERTSKMVVGDPLNEETQCGALISAAHRDKVERYIALGQEEGGMIRCGGTRPVIEGDCAQGFFVAPTIISGLAPTCRTASEEIFGPVVTIHPFKDEPEALALANAGRYGLAASVWTQDLKRGHTFAQSLRTGMVWVNTWLKRDLRVPFGGMKDSGVGREGGRYSLDFFSESRNICIELGD